MAAASIVAIASATGVLDVERAAAFLAKCIHVDDIREVRDRAKAVAVYQRTKAAGFAAQQDAEEIVLRAERRLGELCAATVEHGGDRRSKSQAVTSITLSDLGIEKHESSRWQRLAAIDEVTFERHVQSSRADGARLTAAGALRAATPPSPAKEPATFHPMISLGELREALLARVESVTEGWTAEGLAMVPEVLRDLAAEMEARHDG